MVSMNLVSTDGERAMSPEACRDIKDRTRNSLMILFRIALRNVTKAYAKLADSIC
ncbi:MAG: hypothetical protein R2685_02465 [Candidatus Nitrosocosmicus sp.]|nr:hypothetical protein [Candidatus Nitrosocosmicus sp.]